MENKILTITNRTKEITFYDLDHENEIEVEIDNGYKEYSSVYLNKVNLISLREHIDYLIKKIDG